MLDEKLFRLGEKASSVNEVRRPRTNDIFERLLVISPKKITLKNLLSTTPLAAFNPAMRVEGDKVRVYARVIVEYYTYSSSIAEFTLRLDDVYRGEVEDIEAEVTLIPESEVDFWGTEDPRVTVVKGRELITYTGRTRWFFSSEINKTVPVVAERQKGSWVRKFYFKLPLPLDQIVYMNKDAFPQILDEDLLYVFHRPILKNSPPALWYGHLPLEVLDREELGGEVILDNELIMFPASFEKNVGWGAPVFKVDDEYIAIAHARGQDEVYRLYLLSLECEEGRLKITGVSETYVMEPRETYEKYGDRPHVTFICGAEVIKDKVLISYGAADKFLAFAEAELSELMSSIKKLG